jgi:hypothetical protein
MGFFFIFVFNHHTRVLKSPMLNFSYRNELFITVDQIKFAHLK